MLKRIYSPDYKMSSRSRFYGFYMTCASILFTTTAFHAPNIISVPADISSKAIPDSISSTIHHIIQAIRHIYLRKHHIFHKICDVYPPKHHLFSPVYNLSSEKYDFLVPIYDIYAAGYDFLVADYDF